ncbi:MAG: RluA family pseudouridine synthase [Mariprofundaceae bacterium]|nr:RluA family pseudouridine synthase [Mariprofundaceae bacterium]
MRLASTEKSDSRVVVPQDEQSSRLDRFLIRRLGNASRTLILRLVRKGNVRVNGKRVKVDSRLNEGDSIFLPQSLRGDGGHAAQSCDAVSTSLLQQVAALPVLFEDESLLLVDKPAGVVVHGGSGHGAGLIEALKIERGLPDLRLAHRLDRDTSGVLLMAKNLSALRTLSASFRERDMQKTYFALVSGHPFPHAGRMQSKLAKGMVRGGERMVIDAEEGKEAVTDYQLVMEFCRDGFDFSLLALNPHSGRTHQLRVQLQQEGHAILGDGKYATKEEQTAYKSFAGRGLMLHAWRLRFKHPLTDKALEIKARWPESWRAFLLT